MDDIIAEFITETQENLTDLDTDLIAFEADPSNKELLDKIFRTLHTIKGTCGFLGLTRLEKVAHTAETLLDQFRSEGRQAKGEEVVLILQSLDRIRELIEAIEQTGSEPEGSDTDLIKLLQAAIDQDASAATPAKAEAEPAPVGAGSPWDTTGVAVDEIDFDALEVEMPEIVDTPLPDSIEIPAAEPVVEEAAVEQVDAPVKEAATREGGVTTNQFLRVNVDTLESMMTLVSELVLTRNQIVQLAKEQSESVVGGSLQRLNTVVSELQDSVMKTRMQPIGNAWVKFPRIVHDIARDLKKKIHLDMVGEEAEVDRQVLEYIKDPLMHMVRNSADHGIELPADRKAAGKSETGHIRLGARHEGGYIIIEISDDGKGLNPEKIRETAVKRGLASREQMDSLNEKQVLQYIFEPGFSTAEKVTSVSGRGVGMDVVRTNIEKIGGTVDLESQIGKGSTFTIRIPLTLAIVSALIIECSGNRYAMPQISIRELVRVSRTGDETIEMLGGRPILRFRDRVLPLADLRGLLGSQDDVLPTPDLEDCYVIITSLGNVVFGVIVDQVFDTEEIVVKPVSKILRSVPIFAGNTILGDGQVIMILDPVGIAKEAEVNAIQVCLDSSKKTDLSEVIETNDEKVSLLLFRAGDDTPKAVPSFLVSRIETIQRTDLEYSGGHPLVQYQDRLIELYKIGEIPDTNTICVLIFTDDISGKAFGIVVDEVMDIVNDKMEISSNSARPGFLGAGIIKGQATDILDINHFTGGPEWVKEGSGIGVGIVEGNKNRVLIVEDSAFFRHMLQPLLSMAGYVVTMAENPKKAMKLCEAGHDFDVIVSDIEMGEVSGYDFAEMVRAGTRWKDVPMVALTSKSTPKDMSLGYQKGFTAYLAKSNRDALLNTLHHILSQDKDA